MTVWVILLLSLIIYLLPIRGGEKEWGSSPRYLKPKQVKKKRNLRLRIRIWIRIISNFLFSSDIKQ